MSVVTMPGGYVAGSEVMVSGADGAFLTVPCTCKHEDYQGEPRHDFNDNDSGCTAEDCYCEHGIPLSLDTYW